MLRRAALLALSAVLAGCSGCSPGSPAARAAKDAGSHLPADASVDDGAQAVLPEAGDAAEDVYGSSWDAGNMLSDPSIWTPVPDNNGCGLYVAKVVPDPFPKRQWTTCGTGCEVSDAPMAGMGANAVLWGGVTASERGGHIYLQTSPDGMFGTDKPIHLLLTRRLDDGATIAAVEERNYRECLSEGWGNDAAFVFPVVNAGPQGVHPQALYTVWDRGGTIQGTEPGAPVTWGHWLAESGLLGTTFAWDDGWGIGKNGALYVNTSPDQTAFQIVHSGNDLEVYGRGKLVVWYASDGGKQNAIESYTVSGGIKTLVKLSQGVVWSVALSGDKMVWIVVDGMNWAKYRFTSADLYWSPVATDASGLQVHGPIPLPSSSDTSGYTELRVGGDYAASHGCPLDTCPIAVAQLSTGKVWQIPPRPARCYWGVMAVSEDTILAGETNCPNQDPLDSQYVRRFVRFSTAELDTLQKGW